jgi:hypothetical protein
MYYYTVPNLLLTRHVARAEQKNTRPHRRVDLSSLVVGADGGSTGGEGGGEGEGNGDVGLCVGVYLMHCYAVPSLFAVFQSPPPPLLALQDFRRHSSTVLKCFSILCWFFFF